MATRRLLTYENHVMEIVACLDNFDVLILTQLDQVLTVGGMVDQTKKKNPSGAAVTGNVCDCVRTYTQLGVRSAKSPNGKNYHN